MPSTVFYEVTIPGRLPGMNEFIAANRSNYQKGARMKKKEQEWCKAAMWKQLRNVRITKPVTLHYTFFECNKKRDRDNVGGFAHKVIQDALVDMGVLKNDGWNEVLGYTDEFRVDKKNPRIELVIEVHDG